MAEYEKVYLDPYPNGWKAKPDLSTPYLTSIKDNEDETLRHIEGYLYDNPIGDISSNSIGDLSDVDLTGVKNKDILMYNSTTHKFECSDGGGASGGKNYSTSEVEYGFDRNHNIVYAKTRIFSYDSWEEYQANMSSSFEIINTPHEILGIEGHISFYPSTIYPNNYPDKFEETWVYPFIDPNNSTNRYFYTRIYKGAQTEGVPLIQYGIRFFDGMKSGSQVYRYIKEVAFTVYYVKTS